MNILKKDIIDGNKEEEHSQGKSLSESGDKEENVGIIIEYCNNCNIESK